MAELLQGNATRLTGPPCARTLPSLLPDGRYSIFWRASGLIVSRYGLVGSRTALGRKRRMSEIWNRRRPELRCWELATEQPPLGRGRVSAGLPPNRQVPLAQRSPLFTTKGGTTGLGLSTVHRIVEQACCGIRTHSEPGRGTTFTSLPAASRTGRRDRRFASVTGCSRLRRAAMHCVCSSSTPVKSTCC